MHEEILNAINNKSHVSIKYISSKNEITERLISSIEFTEEFDKFGYYGEHIKAFCHLRNSERHFKIDRILSFRIVDDNFTFDAPIKDTQEIVVENPIDEQLSIHKNESGCSSLNSIKSSNIETQREKKIITTQKSKQSTANLSTKTHDNTYGKNADSNITAWLWGCAGLIFLIWIFGNSCEKKTQSTTKESSISSSNDPSSQPSIAEQQYPDTTTSPASSHGASTGSAPRKPSVQNTREVQQLLTDLGYDPGSVDGVYGRSTSDAVQSFQRDEGIPQNGWIDENLLSTLRRVRVDYKPHVPQPKPQTQSDVQSHSRISTANTSTTTSYFTRGSHQDLVLRVQGFPDAIKDFSALGYEEWKYGDSFVNISTHDGRVTTWSNQGILKVRLFPGPNTSSLNYFTHDSHQDDVLRLQGTPDHINDYSAPGYELWKYGSSSVKISTQDHRVVDWSNKSSNLKVEASGD